MLAVISGDAVVAAIVQIVIAALIYFIMDRGLAKCNVKEPFKTVLTVLMVLLVCAFLINALLSLTGHPLVRW